MLLNLHATARSFLRENCNNKSSIGKIVAKTRISSDLGVTLCVHSSSDAIMCRRHIRLRVAYVWPMQ